MNNRPYYSSNFGYYPDDYDDRESNRSSRTSMTNRDRPRRRTIDSFYDAYADTQYPHSKEYQKKEKSSLSGIGKRLSDMGFFSNRKKLADAEAEKARLQQELRNKEKALSRQRQDADRREQERIMAGIRQDQTEKALREVRERELIDKQRIEREQKAHQEKLKKMKLASPETLRSLRELVRHRYQLDVEIWSLRGARRPDRPIVQQKMEQADAVMDDILTMVGTWQDKGEGSWSDKEWEKVQLIKQRLSAPGKRQWANNPPWAET